MKWALSNKKASAKITMDEETRVFSSSVQPNYIMATANQTITPVVITALSVIICF